MFQRGKAIRFHEDDVRAMGRNSAGVRAFVSMKRRRSYLVDGRLMRGDVGLILVAPRRLRQASRRWRIPPTRSRVGRRDRLQPPIVMFAWLAAACQTDEVMPSAPTARWCGHAGRDISVQGVIRKAYVLIRLDDGDRWSAWSGSEASPRKRRRRVRMLSSPVVGIQFKWIPLAGMTMEINL